jgi:serine/threonine protein phosphatase PrpC
MVRVMNLSAGAATHQGLVRSINEDACLVSPLVVAVADGMGGHAAGDVASSIAIAVLSELGARAQLQPLDVLAAVEAANSAIVARAAADGLLAGMGTTLCGLAIVTVAGAPHLAVFNVGDSRVYRCAPDRLELVTTDHSEVQELVDAGTLTVEQARTHLGRNVITRSIGTEPAPVADIWVFPAQPPQRFLLCSDGLSTELTDDQIHAAIAHPDAQQSATSAVEAAVLAGGRDNVTAVVVDIVGDRHEAISAMAGLDSPTAPRFRAQERR